MRFFYDKDPEENTREQIKKVTSHPRIAKNIPVRGFISMWIPACCGKCSQVHRSLPAERIQITGRFAD